MVANAVKNRFQTYNDRSDETVILRKLGNGGLQIISLNGVILEEISPERMAIAAERMKVLSAKKDPQWSGFFCISFFILAGVVETILAIYGAFSWVGKYLCR